MKQKKIKKLDITQEYRTEDEIEVAIALAGNTISGKSCIKNKYFYNKFSCDSSQSDICKKIELDNLKINLFLFELKAHERYYSLNKMFIEKNNIDGFMFIFDITSKSSFEDLKYFMNWLKENSNKDYSAVICANKSDLNEDREISEEELHLFSIENKLNAFEISAKTGDNIDRAFKKLIRQIIFKEDYNTELYEEFDKKSEIFFILNKYINF